ETRWSAMRVLIVDGEPDPWRALRTALETMEHAVDEAASGPGALKLVERRAYDVTLVDLRLGRDSVLEGADPKSAAEPPLG
ncbi:MAG TPA: response regulator, partial [Isosphaeraceae bacterium]|nr:response regulator [Isosphaeraceae bacterium]